MSMHLKLELIVLVRVFIVTMVVLCVEEKCLIFVMYVMFRLLEVYMCL